MRDQNALNSYISELKKATSADIRTDRYTRVLYSTDASIYQVMPLAVLVPKSLEEVHAAVELAAKYRIPLVARTGGSSLAGQAINEAVVIDFSKHLDRILEIVPEERRVRLQPGIVLDELNLALKPYGLQFGPDPASSNRAAMGGIVSNNSTGSHSILYGMTADHVLEMKVILSDGTRASMEPVDEARLEQLKKASGRLGDIYRKIDEIRKTKAEVIRKSTPRHWRRCGGYNLDRFVSGPAFKYPQDSRFNLAKLICGAEGTLAIITEITLNLVPLPKHTGLAIVQFDRLYDALAATPVILETGPSAVELMDHLGLSLCREVPQYARLLQTFLDGNPNCILLTEFYGESPGHIRDQVERLKTHLNREKVPCQVVPVLESDRQQNVWNVRKVSLGLMMSIKGDYKPIPFIEDAAVPVEHLAEYVTRIEQFCQEMGTRVAYYAHASGGCIHIRPLINTKERSEIQKLPRISEFAVELLGRWGGSLSSEHGDGRCRSWLNERFFGKEMYRLFKEVKHAFDPEHLLNPGIIVDGQPITENLRFGERYRTIPLQEHLDFSADMGFDRAIEMCNGAGICRKKTTGTMCPSFMVTREEMHSTRGRANALRAALSGKLPAEEFTSRQMFDVLDLCIECKACKAECPSSVDMAKIKFEFLVHYYRRHGIPLRAKVLGDLRPLHRLARFLSPALVNMALGNTVVRKVLEKSLGLTARRPLPSLARETFLHWFQNRKPANNSADVVLFFHDCFTTYFDPEVARDAVLVLEAAGFKVELAGHQCCGRTMISKGLFEKARQAATETVEALYPKAAAGLPVVGVEPGCLLALKDDYAYLRLDPEKQKTLARQSFLFEDFMLEVLENQPKRLALHPAADPILLHGHCHQKALIGTQAAKRVLSLCSRGGVEEIDSGCCGMAGSFGYEKEHYELSIAMGERRLFPAVREAGTNARIAAPGFSCRSQIQHGTQRRALHPAQILFAALKA